MDNCVGLALFRDYCIYFWVVLCVLVVGVVRLCRFSGGFSLGEDRGSLE